MANALDVATVASQACAFVSVSVCVIVYGPQMGQVLPFDYSYELYCAVLCSKVCDVINVFDSLKWFLLSNIGGLHCGHVLKCSLQ